MLRWIASQTEVFKLTVLWVIALGFALGGGHVLFGQAASLNENFDPSGQPTLLVVFEDGADLKAGEPAAGKLIGEAKVRDGALIVPASSESAAVYGDQSSGALNFFPQMKSEESWGQCTIAAVVEMDQADERRHTLLSTGGGPWELPANRHGILINFDSDDNPPAAYRGPSISFYYNWQQQELTQFNDTPKADTPYFIAFSWNDHGDKISVRSYLRPLSDDGDRPQYRRVIIEDPAAAEGASGPKQMKDQHLYIGGRPASTDSLGGQVKILQIQPGFADTEKDFEQLFKQMNADNTTDSQ